MAVTLLLGVFLLLAGIVLFAIEIAHPGVFLLIPASVIIAAGLLFVFLPNWISESIIGPGIIILVAFAATLLTIPYYRRIAPVHPPMATNATSLQGEIGLVVTPVQPDSLAGKVRVRSEVWSARSDRPIPAGTHVRILGGEGVSLNVAPVDQSGGG